MSLPHSMQSLGLACLGMAALLVGAAIKLKLMGGPQ